MYRSSTVSGNSTPAARRGTRVGVAFGLVGLLVLAATARAQYGAPQGVSDGAANRGRMPRAPEAMARAIELQRRGDLEQAASQLSLAQAQLTTLSPDERQELARLI